MNDGGENSNIQTQIIKWTQNMFIKPSYHITKFGVELVQHPGF